MTPPIKLVKPRVLSPITGDAILLEDVVQEWLDRDAVGWVLHLTGASGSGRSLALKYVADFFAETNRVHCVDRTWFTSDTGNIVLPTDKLTLISRFDGSVQNLRRKGVGRYELAPWGEDEAIEYLLATQPQCCAHVMPRVKAFSDRHLLGGLAELWCIVLDQMAGDESTKSVTDAIRRHFAWRAGSEVRLQIIRKQALAFLLKSATFTSSSLDRLGLAELHRLIRHRSVQAILAADAVAAAIRGSGELLELTHLYPVEVIKSVAKQVDESGDQRLLKIVHDPMRHDRHSTAASLLHACGRRWRADQGFRPNLREALLSGAQWPDIDLSRCIIAGCDLTNADLSNACLGAVRDVRWLQLRIGQT